MTLETVDLTATVGGFSLGPLSLSVERGVTAVLGPSGAGKSTLLELIAGFETPQSGTITLGGTRIDGLSPEERTVGMVFQDAALFPHLSVRENLRFGATTGKRVAATAKRLEIDDLLDRDPTTLSGGERQRVALARTLVTDPEALLLDEPLSSLDAPIRRRLRLELRDVLAGLDIPVLYVTHDQEEAAVVGDRVAVLVDGEIRQAGPVETVFDEPATPTVARFLGMENVFEGTVVGRDGGQTTVDVGPTTLTAHAEVETDSVLLGVRPADVTVPAATNGDNTLSGRIKRVVSNHTDATVVLSCDGIGRLQASVDRAAADDLAPGQNCRVAIDPNRLHLIPESGP